MFEISNARGSDVLLYVNGPKLSPRFGVSAYLANTARMDVRMGIFSCLAPVAGSETDNDTSTLFTSVASRRSFPSLLKWKSTVASAPGSISPSLGSMWKSSRVDCVRAWNLYATAYFPVLASAICFFASSTALTRPKSMPLGASDASSPAPSAPGYFTSSSISYASALTFTFVSWCAPRSSSSRTP